MWSFNCKNLAMMLLILLSCGTIIGQVDIRYPGSEPYTPSRLEWLAVDMNARMRVLLTQDSKYLLSLVPIENENAILIYVIYLPSVERSVMNSSIEGVKEVIRMSAKAKGWDDWLQIKEQIRMAEK